MAIWKEENLDRFANTFGDGVRWEIGIGFVYSKRRIELKLG